MNFFPLILHTLYYIRQSSVVLRFEPRINDRAFLYPAISLCASGEFSAFVYIASSASVSTRIKIVRSSEHVWWAADRRRSPPFYAVPAGVPVVLAPSTPFLFSTVVRAKTFSINASFFLLLSVGRRARAKAILKTPARCNKANCFSHA